MLWALHGYFVPTNKVVKKSSQGGKEVIKYTIKDSQESFLYLANSNQEIQEHLHFLKARKEHIQPFILCTFGDEITDIQEILLYFDETIYKFINMLRAVDICFKIIYLFNLDFPKESIMFWSFIELHYFKMKGTTSYPKAFILSEALKEC